MVKQLFSRWQAEANCMDNKHHKWGRMVKKLFSRWQAEADCMANDEDHEPWFVIVPDDQDHDHEQRRTRAPVPRWLPDDHDEHSPRTVWVAKTGYRYHMDFGCSGATLPMALPQAKLLGRAACSRCPGTRRTVPTGG